MPAKPEHAMPAAEQLEGLRLLRRGKVRDIYAVDSENLLLLASDRISAFDVILPDPIPGKGAILTQLSNFWFHKTARLQRNHLTALSVADVLPAKQARRLERCAVIVQRLRPLPVEAVVRGYIIGSAWRDYRQNGRVCGVRLPGRLRLADRLPHPIFTPSTKAETGEHDANISFAALSRRIGAELADQVRDASMTLYQTASEHARKRGIIIADCKFEFGLDRYGELILMDEILTPDAARFWPADAWRPGRNPPSYDKQFVRDYLESLDWNKKPPAPRLPPEIIDATVERYRKAYELLTGQPWVDG